MTNELVVADFTVTVTVQEDVVSHFNIHSLTQTVCLWFTCPNCKISTLFLSCLVTTIRSEINPRSSGMYLSVVFQFIWPMSQPKEKYMDALDFFRRIDVFLL